MNQKTAKLINRFCSVTRNKPKTIKKYWNETPRKDREAVRRLLQARVDEATAQS